VSLCAFSAQKDINPKIKKIIKNPYTANIMFASFKFGTIKIGGVTTRD
jgi:hypothetical protein